MRRLALTLVLISSGCRGGVFVCTDVSDCGSAGVCEADGYCSFSDASCPSMRRYGEHAPSGVAGACVDTGTDTSTSGAVADGGSSSTALAPESGEVEAATSSDADEGGGSSSGTRPTTEESTTSPGESSTTGDTGMPSVIGPLTITDDLDDGAIALGSGRDMPLWLPSGESPGYGYCGEFPDSLQYFAYLRFTLPQALPADAELDGAVLELYGHGTYLWDDTHALRVWAEYSDDAAQVDGVSDHPASMGGAPLGDASVRWATGDDNGLTWQVPGPNTTDVAPLLQQLVDDQGGLVAGAHVQLWVTEDVLDAMGSEVGWYDSLAGAETAPRLTLSLR